MGLEGVMFSTLLNNGVTLMAALLGKLKKPKRLQAMTLIVLLFCIVTLVLTVVTENPFQRKESAPQPALYDASISPISVTAEDAAGREDGIIRLEIRIPKEIERMAITFSISFN